LPAAVGNAGDLEEAVDAARSEALRTDRVGCIVWPGGIVWASDPDAAAAVDPPAAAIIAAPTCPHQICCAAAAR
jgi:hypothetical protein